jgi:hypothetical protein
LDKPTIEVLRDVDPDFNHHHPSVQAASAACMAHINMIKAGPENYNDIINGGTYNSNNKYVDTAFTGNATLYDQWTASSTVTSMNNGFADSTTAYYFSRMSTKYPAANIFDNNGEPTWLEPNQGGAGTCYIMSAMSAVAEFP